MRAEQQPRRCSCGTFPSPRRTQTYDVREVLDELIGRRVAAQAAPERVAALQGAPRRDGAGDGRRRRKRYHAVNLRFHDMLVEFAGNARLCETYRLLTKELLLFRLRGLQDGGGFAVSVPSTRR